MTATDDGVPSAQYNFWPIFTNIAYAGKIWGCFAIKIFKLRPSKQIQIKNPDFFWDLSKRAN